MQEIFNRMRVEIASWKIGFCVVYRKLEVGAKLMESKSKIKHLNANANKVKNKPLATSPLFGVCSPFLCCLCVCVRYTLATFNWFKCNSSFISFHLIWHTTTKSTNEEEQTVIKIGLLPPLNSILVRSFMQMTWAYMVRSVFLSSTSLALQLTTHLLADDGRKKPSTVSSNSLLQCDSCHQQSSSSSNSRNPNHHHFMHATANMLRIWNKPNQKNITAISFIFVRFYYARFHFWLACWCVLVCVSFIISFGTSVICYMCSLLMFLC